jgi:hypothetical protein
MCELHLTGITEMGSFTAMNELGKFIASNLKNLRKKALCA